MKLAFYSNQLGLRGTEVALYDYARLNEQVLGNKSIIFTSNKAGSLEAKNKFTSKFEVYEIDTNHIDEECKNHNVDVFYAQKAGWNDGIYAKNTHSAIHVVFKGYQPHGDRIGFISDYLAKTSGHDPKDSSVPYFCNRLEFTEENLRSELYIKDDALVLGYLGGRDQFSLDFVRSTIIENRNFNSNIVYLFMNIDPFPLPDITYKHNFIFLPGTYDLEYKNKFINTCDAMLHARKDGETFGMSIAEYALKNKPIITYRPNQYRRFDNEWEWVFDINYVEKDIELAHLDMLGEYGLYYKDGEELKYIINNFHSLRDNMLENLRSFSAPYLKYNNPTYIMDRFNSVFLT